MIVVELVQFWAELLGRMNVKVAKTAARKVFRPGLAIVQ